MKNLLVTFAGLAAGLAFFAPANPALAADDPPVFPFVLPWDDASPSVADMSGLLDPPAGKHGFIRVSDDGHFQAGGRRVRFFGVNLSFAGGMPTHADAPQIAGRLAKFGVNVVRFHHLDTGAWPNGIRDTTVPGSGGVHPEALDRLGFFLARLKERGIYANLNLLVGRPFSAADGLPAEIEPLDWKDRHLVGFFDARQLQLQKDYARRLLTWKNPHTGLTLAEDPAVAFVEINNEQGLVHGWLGGNVDRLPEVFLADLRRQWNDWLQVRHGDTAKLRAAWQADEERPGPQLLRNAGFGQELQNWRIEQHQGATLEAAVEDNTPVGTRNIVAAGKAVRLRVTKPGVEGWHLQFQQAGIELASGRPYTVRFWAKADAPRAINVSVSQAHDPWRNLGLNASARLSHEWREFRYVFNAAQSDDNARLSFANLGGEGATVWLTGLSFKTGGVLGLLPAEDLATANVPLFARDRFGERTPDAQRDWMRFLFATEERYWQALYRFLKDELNVRAPITGTIAGCSPVNLQAQLDWVDTHSYWQHPRWTGGRDWDAENWIVENRSLVNERGGTLAGLALRRVLGKPHACTEYNHPAPNTYSSEGFLLLAAYAALQDWDAIYVYSYAHSRGQGWDSRKINGFFDIDQHPTKMATLPAAVAMFVRGDVRAAEKLITAPLPREREMDLMRTARNWDLVHAGHVGVPREAALFHRVALLTEGVAAPVGVFTPEPAAFKANLLTADTGELTWDLTAANRGVVIVNTARSKAVIGYGGGRRFELGPALLEPAQGLQDGWSAITLTEREPGRWLVTATGYTENTGMKWKNPERSSVGRDWGEAPSRVEGVVARLTWKAAPDRVQAWALDERGQRREPVPAKPAPGRQTGALLQLGPQWRTLWYEVEVKS